MSMKDALDQVWAELEKEQDRQRAIVLQALDSVAIITASDAALERLRAGLDALNAKTGTTRLQGGQLAPSQMQWLSENEQHLAPQTNGRLQ